jgi:hypothetical protein
MLLSTRGIKEMFKFRRGSGNCKKNVFMNCHKLYNMNMKHVLWILQSYSGTWHSKAECKTGNKWLLRELVCCLSYSVFTMYVYTDRYVKAS